MQATFVISAVEKEQWPDSNLPEVVVVGRSNVGKSSFINALTNRKRLAYVGNTPGKTRLINFFDIDGTWMLVDVPGYGYARMSKEMLKKMGKMMEDYFSQREQLKLAIQLVDARHDPTNDDLDMIEYFKSLQIPILLVATKIDKIPKTKRVKALKNISQKLQLPLKNIYGISSTEKIGFDEVYQAILNQIQ
ncbi:ribosome biogenesis GTP-binding protein YihA/YsxC [Faecalicoccus pleomorphus]|uniref:ribosome biogenesis GTP-binding protein YihA/YsxC n=1 Tax=Faecalicoccus pleomorphus TaxID=1323 RepID=UPI001961519A|nr:ribosome biogenesis GTP-binding protein YihA/YsxC [Faecalicoccus pleomorphus]MBM6765086.1 YihA family ribosome biogenesis GTP-binding protein [Faecalicoccus pleomorphus]MBM6809013.1 YihA family ribosome biogenesis GTP-binding protein [Faecalicoccus pleomorphus]